MLSPRLIDAAPGACEPDPLEGNRVICTGDQSAGIASGIDFDPVVFDTLDIVGVNPYPQPPSGTDGVVFRRTSAGNVTINSGTPGVNIVWIVATGAGARGIVAESIGTPPPAVDDPFLGIPIPGAGVSGGVVEVNYFGLLTTDGDNGDGIVASSRTSGYPATVRTALETFDPSGFTFDIVSAIDPEGGPPVAPGQAVKGTLYELVDTNGDGLLEEREVVGGNGGTFVLNADGTFILQGVTLTQDTVTRVQYLTQGTNAGNATEDAYGYLTVGLDEDNIVKWQAEFKDIDSGAPKWGTQDSSNVSFGDPGATLPNLEAYAADLLEQATGGGAGNSVNVNVGNQALIWTQGDFANGVTAESVGANGPDGRDAYTGCLGFCGHSSTRGEPGNAGGTITIDAQGLIRTDGEESVAVLAESTGGNGGQGGDSSTGRNSKAGGAGGAGGDVVVRGDTLDPSEGYVTAGDNAVGILAISRGGNGGGGGDGATFNSAEDGGPGGAGGRVDISGAWHISTTGDEAHGIWGKAVGGRAGGGGDGGWTGTSAGSGGFASAGGDVTIDSAGNIQTTGKDAFGIYAQSVGGFGGNGGDTASIFVASGGSGASAGPGGTIDVTNRGRVVTSGERSHAIFAQSVGGGGGSGGDGGALVGYGGGSASGGFGGEVSVLNTATGVIQTSGDSARGIYAQSVGGGGGDGGDGAGVAGIGGRGSGTSDGGPVSVTNDGSIVTQGNRANAIFAESVGGGGGDGGDSAGLISVGGKGGGGGNADVVTVDNNNLLMTSGHDASAIFAQSVGGGGGNGGSSVAFGAFASVAIGGDGAVGGDAGEEVRVGSLGTITSEGDRSHGMFAQSVGGGGGNGGFAISASLGQGASFSAAIGGKGGGGGLGKLVTVNSGGDIATSGKDAHGIFAQSVGGGGGSGGFAIAASGSDGFAASAALGGKGGAGNRGGAVVVNNTASITTGLIDPATLAIDALDNIDADIRQLLGTQFATIGELAAASTADIAAIAGIDGFATAGIDELGGAGVPTEVQQLKDASAALEEAAASGYYSAERTAELRNMKADTIGLLQSKRFGDLNSIEVPQEHTLPGCPITVGFIEIPCPDPLFFGISDAPAQQIIGAARRYAQTVPETLLDQATLQMQRGNHSYGILAQSVGGGGGDGGFSVAGAVSGSGSASFSMGGDGGSGGNAGSVDLDSTGDISTRGDDAHAIVAQSVGGGGGTGGFSVAGSLSGGSGAAASVGGSGGGGGDGGPVRVGSSASLLAGNIATLGDHAYGLLAQSVGGGGGDGGFSVAGTLSKGSNASFSMGGSGGPGGVGGSVDVQSNANFTTSGKDAHGIVAQSVGGGGGSGGFSIAGGLSGDTSVSASLGGSGASGGNSNLVRLWNTGTIGTGVAGKYSAPLSALDDVDAGTISLLSGAGIDTVAELAATPQDGLDGIAGIDPATANAALEKARRFMQRDSHSYGILAQSVGGGGGDGGFSVAGTASKGPGVSFGLGGAGAGGGGAGVVDVANLGNIVTHGQLGYGILAQSVGGGGGSGGFSVSASLSKESGGVSASLGGGGGGGGGAGAVELDNLAVIETNDAGSHAIFAQSVGGGGGAGGFSGAISGGFGNDSKLGYSVGGFGGDGGDGNNVRVAHLGPITTRQQAAYGIFAQSIGGGGGDGGFSLAATLGKADKSWNGNVSIGGFGGDGGIGGDVQVVTQGEITTEGAQSHAIVVQSVGGGGGNGGFSAAGSIVKGQNTKSLSVGVGGFGGDGSRAGNVFVDNRGNITTQGLMSAAMDFREPGAPLAEDRLGTLRDGAVGILAQSIGGGGGNGGLSFAGNFSGAEAKNVSVAVGGTGGVGGEGRAVTVINDGRIATLVQDSHGIVAQSIGGGGGNGGASYSVGAGFGGDASKSWNVNASASIGGAGGSGDRGGIVGVTNRDVITTVGDDSHGILAQSIGGGGGTGGSSFSGTLGGEAKTQGSVMNSQLSVGGQGGDSDNNVGGDVSVLSEAAIQTSGDKSDAIHAQSIGGGGGDGGSAKGLSILTNRFGAKATKNSPIGKNYDFRVSVGGAGGTGNIGGVVDVVNDASITTTGEQSRGIVAQSVGGGGGSGGDGAKGTGTVLDFLEVDNSYGGGTAGQSKFSKGGAEQRMMKKTRKLSVAVGGDGGDNGHGGAVNVNSTGDILTTGWASTAILAKSIGGGGGEAQSFYKGVAEGGSSVAGATAANVRLGGAGGTAGDGGDVGVDYGGGIDTSGAEAHGIQAMSIGGGGGIAGNIDRGLLRELAGDIAENFDFYDPDLPNFDVVKYARYTGVNVAIAQDGGGAGDGGIVRVEGSGDIHTRGDDAHGIKAQSIGGGGGSASGRTDEFEYFHFNGSVGGSGSGGDVTVTHVGNITTEGQSADGIYAQSAGGTNSEPNVVFAAGNVTVTVTGDITASGPGSNGIFAESDSLTGNRDISVTILDGTVTGGTVGEVSDGAGGVEDFFGAGVRFASGANNRLNNSGTVTSQDGIDGFAMIAGAGRETVLNGGIVTGSIDLGIGGDVFANEGTGTVNAGEMVDLAGSGLFFNYGTLAPGGDGNVFTTTLDGNLIQDIAGSISLDVFGFRAGEFDQLFVTGDFLLQGPLGVLPGVDPGGSVVFNLLDALSFAELVDSISIFDFILGGTPELPTVLADASLFDELTFMGRNSSGTFGLLLQSDGSFAAVPIPAAAWLFGSALGLLGWMRRRSR